MNSVPTGLISIASLPADVRAKLGLSLPEPMPQVTSGEQPAQDPQAPRTTWAAFWPYAIDVIRKHEEKAGTTKAKQTILMKFAGTLKKKPYAEWTDSEILAEYNVWVPPPEEEAKATLKTAKSELKAVLKEATAQLKEVEKEIESKKKGKATKKIEEKPKEKPVDKPAEKSEEKPKAKKVKQQKEDTDPPVPPTPTPKVSETPKLVEVPLPPSPPETETDTSKEPVHIRRKNIPKHIKNIVWNKHMGSGVAEAKCVSCRETVIKITSFHCGHVVAESKGGDTNINNLRPICADCNLAMGTRSMNEFTSEFFGWTV